jgi:hypothetical protein
MITIYDRIKQAKEKGYTVTKRFGGFWLVAPNGAWLRGPFPTELLAWQQGGIPEYYPKALELDPEPKKTPRKRTPRKKKAGD